MWLWWLKLPWWRRWSSNLVSLSLSQKTNTDLHLIASLRKIQRNILEDLDTNSELICTRQLKYSTTHTCTNSTTGQLYNYNLTDILGETILGCHLDLNPRPSALHLLDTALAFLHGLTSLLSIILYLLVVFTVCETHKKSHKNHSYI